VWRSPVVFFFPSFFFFQCRDSATSPLSVLPAQKIRTGESKAGIKLEKWKRVEELGFGCMGGAWEFKAPPQSAARLWPRALLLAKESSRGVGWGEGEKKVWGKKKKLYRKSFLKTSQSGNQNAELNVAKCPRGGQEH